jgi:hypothetical protein
LLKCGNARSLPARWRKPTDRLGNALSLQVKLTAVTLNCPDPLALAAGFAVEDLDEEEARLLELGAGKPDHQPGDEWVAGLHRPGNPISHATCRLAACLPMPARKPTGVLIRYFATVCGNSHPNSPK